ncbi:MAG TPA: TonB-dependent receptor [Candidatus Acidoferrales bacterium]|nr:TonB-dependent receptor [Candidatus Acidoferrales bacterium]
MNRIIYGILCALLFCVVGVDTALAQTTGGTMRGTVTDAQGLAISGAKVSITNTQTGVTVPLDSNSAGVYNFPDLTVGTYQITVEKDGFKKYLRGGIQIFANQVTEVNVGMEVGSVASTVEVSGGTPLIETATSQISNDFTSLQVTQLPNADPSGSQLQLSLLAPGTTGQQAGITGEGGSIGGARPRFNSFTIDGVDDNRIDLNGHEQYVIPDTVAEFNLLTNQFSAEYGHSAGGQFNTVTKSGTNTWHGDGWEYNNNRNYDAYDNLEKQHAPGTAVPPKPRSDFNRFGADAGGPIVHDKFFIYGAYQKIVQGLASLGVGQSTPTAAGLTTLESISDTAVQAIFKQFPVAAAQTGTETVTVPGTSCVDGCPIPIGGIVPLAPSFLNQYDFMIKADANLGKHTLTFDVLYDRNRQPNLNASTPEPQFTGSTGEDARKYLVKDTWTISSSVVNEFRTAFSRLVVPFEVPAAFTNFPNAEVDTLGVNIGPQGCSPQATILNTYEVVDSMSYVRGKHNFKWGGTWAHSINPSGFLPRARGEWDYKTLDQLANDEVPTGRNGALRGAGSGKFRGNENSAGMFVQDDWKLFPRLTLNLGLRYEWNGIPLDDNLQNLNSISSLPGVINFGTPKADMNNFAPRLGFAYDPTGSGKWVVRGGFGISYDVTPQNFPSISLPPQLQTEQNPTLTCGLAGAPAWCADFTGGSGLGHGFLQGGGLLTVNIPCADQLTCRKSSSSTIVNIVEPKVLTWSAGVQHELPWNSSIEVRYVGTRSLELPIQARLNTQTGFDAGLLPIPTYFSAGAVPGTVASPAVTLGTWDAFENNGGGAKTPTGCADPSPFKYGVQGFCGALVTGFPPLANAIYHGISADFNHRVGHGLTLRANYTYSRNYDDATNELFTSSVNPRRGQDWRHVNQDWGLSALDVPNKLALSWVYDLPASHGDNALERGFTSGWELAGSWLAANGTPLTIINGGDANGDLSSAGDRPFLNPAGTKVNFAGANPGDHVQVDFVCNDGAGGATRIVAFNDTDVNGFANCGSNNDSNVVGYVAHDPTAKYVTAGLGAKSNLGHVGFRSPGYNVWNMYLQKDTKIGERVHFALSVAAYDLFNHRNFALAQPDVFQAANGSFINLVNNALTTTYTNIQATGDGSVNCGCFLQPRQFSGGSRILRLGLKVVF